MTAWIRNSGASVPQNHLQVAHVLLSLLEQGAQRLSHVGQLELVGLAEAFPVALELLGLQAKVGFDSSCDCHHAFRQPGRCVLGSPPRNETCSARICACESSWARWAFNSVTMPVNSAPLMVAMWLVYWTIDWYSVPRSSFSRATDFSTSTGASGVSRAPL